MSDESQECQCYVCGGFFPRMPGIPNTLDVACAHVAAPGWVHSPPGDPCTIATIERTRKLYKLDTKTVWAVLDYWDDELVETVIVHDDHPTIPDPDGWSGACRAEGVSW